MSSFISDEQFDQCVAVNKRAAQAIDWKDLPTKVVYRVQPRGSVETKRGSDTFLELVNRENEEVKVWVPSSVMNALDHAPPKKKIPYLRSLGVQRKRKVFETVFFQYKKTTKKIKVEDQQSKSKQKRRELCKKIDKILQKIPDKEKFPQVECQSPSKEKIDVAVKSMDESITMADCDTCGEDFSRRGTLARHKKYSCDISPKTESKSQSKIDVATVKSTDEFGAKINI